MREIRPETAQDVDAIYQVNSAAFPTPSEAKLVDKLRVSSAWIPELSLVAIFQGQVVGHALITRCRIGDAPGLALAPVAVLPDYQRTGVGSELVAAAIGAAREQDEGTPIVVLGHKKFYPRFGFESAAKYGIRAPWDVPDGALMVLSSGRDVPSGVVEYAAPFME